MFWCKKASLKRTALFLTSMVLLFVLFSQLAGAAPGNLSISGTKFLDLNSNIIRDKSDPTLPGFIIYIDDNNNTKWDQGENYTRTAENGVYTFLNLSSGIYIIRELVSSGDKFQPSSPQKGYQLVNLTGKSATGVDFGNSMPAAAKASTGSETDSIIPILLAFFAFLLIIAGLIALYRAWSELNSLEPKEDKKTKIQMLIASGFILLFLGLYLAVSLLQLWKNMTGEETIIMGNSFAIVTPVILTLLVLGAVLLMLWVQNKLQEPNETGGMRKTIAGLLVVGLIAIVLFALSGTIKNENQNIITQYIQLVGIVIAFYFGSKATSDAYKGASESDEGDAEKDLDIENIIYDSSGEGSISMDITNKNKRNFILKKISIKEGENELFSYAYPEPGWPVSETQKTYPVGPLPFGSKKNQMDSAIKEVNKEYTIALDTSIKQKSVKRTIAKKA